MVADTIRQAWVDFATTGDPGWPAFGRQGQIMLLDDPRADHRDQRRPLPALAELAG